MKKTSKGLIAIYMFGYAVFLIFAIGVGFFTVENLKNEKLLNAELEELDYLFNNYDLNYNEIDKKLNNYVTTDDYLTVEKAMKDYWKEIVKNCRRLEEIYNNQDLYLVLSFDNFYSDSPNFMFSQNIIDTSITQLQDVKNNLAYLFDKNTILSFIEEYSLDKFYIDYYKDLMIDEDTIVDSRKEIENSIDYTINALKIYQELFKLLQDNQNSWYLYGDYIYFDDDNVLNKYNELLDLIENIDFSDVNIEQYI